jgi:hypothetical protein
MRSAFYISDSTAITAEVFGHALLSLFPEEFNHTTIPFVETIEKARQITRQIEKDFQDSGVRPLVFYTILNAEIKEIISSSAGISYNFLDRFVAPLEKELGIMAKPEKHRTHSIHEQTYDIRIQAVNFAIANDDGINLENYANADIVLIGVSRSGKTPTSLYLAMQYGINAANYPTTEDDMVGTLKLPEILRKNKEKLFGLTIDAKLLHEIRSGRRANSRYASLKQCQKELRETENMYRMENIPFINSSRFSIEEISTRILEKSGLTRRKY